MSRPDQELESIYLLVLDLQDKNKREHALLELSKKRESVADLAPILWYSHGTMAILLQEIISIYPLLSPPKLKGHQSDRVCTALALLQSVASHRSTRTLFLNGAPRPPLLLLVAPEISNGDNLFLCEFWWWICWVRVSSFFSSTIADRPRSPFSCPSVVLTPLFLAHIPLFLYPFLNTATKSRPFEYLRLTSLGVIGALVKARPPVLVDLLRVARRSHFASLDGRYGRDQLPSLHRNYPACPAHHGVRQRALQDGRHLHCAKGSS